MPADKATDLAKKIIAIVKDNATASKPRCPVREFLLCALMDEMSERGAATLLNRLERSFVDWNEARVSSVFEIAAAMDDGGLTHLERAGRIRELLRRVFDQTNDMTLSSFADMTQREVVRAVSRILGTARRSRKPEPVPSADQHAAPRAKQTGGIGKAAGVVKKTPAKAAAPAKRGKKR